METRLGELRADARNLLIGGAVVALGIVGAGWLVYKDAMGELSKMAVSQQQLAGKLDTLDAKMSGKFELMEQKLDSNSAQPAKVR